MSWIKVGHESDLAVGEMKQISMEEDDLALYHIEEGFFATSDVCTHAAQSLSQGTLEGAVVACPRHGGKFDVRTGQPTAFPCVIPIATYPVEIRDGEIWIDYDE